MREFYGGPGNVNPYMIARTSCNIEVLFVIFTLFKFSVLVKLNHLSKNNNNNKNIFSHKLNHIDF